MPFFHSVKFPYFCLTVQIFPLTFLLCIFFIHFVKLSPFIYSQNLSSNFSFFLPFSSSLSNFLFFFTIQNSPLPFLLRPVLYSLSQIIFSFFYIVQNFPPTFLLMPFFFTLSKFRLSYGAKFFCNFSSCAFFFYYFFFFTVQYFPLIFLLLNFFSTVKLPPFLQSKNFL